MYAIDFEYDGRYLSDYGFIVCSFDDTNGVNTVESGAEITFNTVSMHRGNKYSLTSTKYESCVTAEFCICKNPDVYDDKEITDLEYRKISKWLNRKEFLPFMAIDDDHDNDICYYDASFNLKKVKILEKVYGISLTMNTNKPFGYGELVEEYIDSDGSETIYEVENTSDEFGCMYPDIEIVIPHDIDSLTISNITNGSIMQLYNCMEGETINIYGESQIIETSYNSHDICDDFNYEFLTLRNLLDDCVNQIKVSDECSIKISYYPVNKSSL